MSGPGHGPSDGPELRPELEAAVSRARAALRDGDWPQAVRELEAANVLVVGRDGYPGEPVLADLNRALLGAIDCIEAGDGDGIESRLEEVEELLPELS